MRVDWASSDSVCEVAAGDTTIGCTARVEFAEAPTAATLSANATELDR